MTEFPKLRLSAEEWGEYRKSIPLQINGFGNPCIDDPKIKITGYNDGARAAIGAINHGMGFIEMQWTMFDSMRLEEKLRIPFMYWRLVGGGMILEPAVTPQSCSLFQGQECVELLLVPDEAISEYLAYNIKQHQWKKLEPGYTKSEDPRERANALFHLINPANSRHWDAYITQRQEAEVRMQKYVLGMFDGEDLDSLLGQIKDGVETLLCHPRDTYMIEDLMEESIFDSVLPLQFDTTPDGWGSMREAELTTRIYSPTRPAAVDVHFYYYYRTRYESVDFFSEMCFRVHDPVKPDLDLMTCDRKNSDWEPVFTLSLAELPPGPRWRPVEERAFHIRPFVLNALHMALFGSSKPTANILSRITLLELMFRAVGIVIKIARDDTERDAFGRSAVTWDLADAEWFGVNIRKACGASLARDAKYVAPEDNRGTGFVDEWEDDEERSYRF